MKHLVVVVASHFLFFLVLSLTLVASFPVVPKNEKTASTTTTTTTTTTDISSSSFHQVLQRLGKTVLRPGGSAATAVMHQWATGLMSDNNNSNTATAALELSSGLGTGGMALASRFRCHIILTDRDESRLAQARELARTKGLEDLVETRCLDMHNITMDLGKQDEFAAILVEASLTHETDTMKKKILCDIQKHTNQLLLHEIVLRGDDDDESVCRRVASALAIGFFPKRAEQWRNLIEESGYYTVTHLETGPIRMLHPQHLLQDEGVAGMAKIAWNLATQSDLRDRVVATKSVIDANRDHLGYIILRAIRKE